MGVGEVFRNLKYQTRKATTATISSKEQEHEDAKIMGADEAKAIRPWSRKKGGLVPVTVSPGAGKCLVRTDHWGQLGKKSKGKIGTSQEGSL